MRWGSSVKAFEARREATGITPKPLRNRPNVRRADRPYLEAFYACSASRPPAFQGLAPIPLSEIGAYCALAGIRTLEERQKVMRVVKAVDRAYLDQHDEEAARRRPASTKKG